MVTHKGISYSICIYQENITIHLVQLYDHNLTLKDALLRPSPMKLQSKRTCPRFQGRTEAIFMQVQGEIRIIMLADLRLSV